MIWKDLSLLSHVVNTKLKQLTSEHNSAGCSYDVVIHQCLLEAHIMFILYSFGEQQMLPLHFIPDWWTGVIVVHPHVIITKQCPHLFFHHNNYYHAFKQNLSVIYNYYHASKQNLSVIDNASKQNLYILECYL